MNTTFKYSTRFQMPEFRLAITEVVKVMNDRPHLLVRATISGTEFPHRAQHPFIHVRLSDNVIFGDLFTEVSADSQSLVGYLPVDLPSGGIIEFGYGNEIWGSIPGKFDPAVVERLDRKRLPKDLTVVDEVHRKRMMK